MERRKLAPITKLDAARRQIDFAIAQHFAEGDPFAIHTVVAAALGILRALAESRGDVHIHTSLKGIIRPGMETKFWGALNRASNFLKHADRDPEATLENVDEAVNEPTLHLACLYYLGLAGQASDAMTVYIWWFVALNPNLMAEDFQAELQQRLQAMPISFEEVKTLPRHVLLQAGRELLNQTGGGIRVPPLP
jgi:hypothetical protein